MRRQADSVAGGSATIGTGNREGSRCSVFTLGRARGRRPPRAGDGLGIGFLLSGALPGRDDAMIRRGAHRRKYATTSVTRLDDKLYPEVAMRLVLESRARRSRRRYVVRI